MQFLLIVHGVKGMWKPIECMTHVTFASWLPVRVVAFFFRTSDVSHWYRVD